MQLPHCGCNLLLRHQHQTAPANSGTFIRHRDDLKWHPPRIRRLINLGETMLQRRLHPRQCQKSSSYALNRPESTWSQHWWHDAIEKRRWVRVTGLPDADASHAVTGGAPSRTGQPTEQPLPHTRSFASFFVDQNFHSPNECPQSSPNPWEQRLPSLLPDLCDVHPSIGIAFAKGHPLQL